MKEWLQPAREGGEQVVFVDFRPPYESRRFDLEKYRGFARQLSTPVATITAEDELTCARCSQKQRWSDTFWQDKTVGTPLQIGSIPDTHARIFCGLCGALVAQEFIDGSMVRVGETRPVERRVPATEGGTRIIVSDFKVPYELERFDVAGYAEAVRTEKEAWEQARTQSVSDLSRGLDGTEKSVRLASAIELGQRAGAADAATALVKAFRRDNPPNIQSACEHSLIQLGTTPSAP